MRGATEAGSRPRRSSWPRTGEDFEIGFVPDRYVVLGVHPGTGEDDALAGPA